MPSDPPATGAPRRAGRHSRPPKRTPRRRLWWIVTLVAALGAIAIGVHIGLFYLRTDTGGSALLRRQRSLDASARRGPGGSSTGGTSSVAGTPASTGSTNAGRTASPAACTSPAAASAADATNSATNGPRGLLQAPSIGLDAPVVEGVGASQLAVAVGHVPASAWPGTAGTAVLSAHDVSWFSAIDHLVPGAAIRFVTPCFTYIYKVTSHQVISAGSPIYDTAKPRIVLVTCYPLDALFLTPKRYVVDASLTKVVNGGHKATLPPAGSGQLPLSLPTAVASEVAPRVTTTAPLGRLRLLGTPTAPWRESLKPINAGGSVLTEFFGALDIAAADNAEQWAALAPAVPMADAGPLHGGKVTAYPGRVAPSITVAGSEVTSAQVHATVDIAGGSSPGAYTITMKAAMSGGRLVVTAWKTLPAA